MALKLTDQEKELMGKYDLDEKDIRSIRKQLALDDIRDSRAKSAAEAKAAAELAAARKEEEPESENDFEIQ